jgi:hypothetical protein
MTSIFDLKTEVKELSSSNQGTSRMEYQQVPPSRDVTTSNFSNGAISIKWQNSGNRWWCPNRSYIRFRCQLSRGDNTQLKLTDNIAPNMGLCASLFQSAEFRINDKTVSRVSDFMPQIDALETRLTKSRSWLNGIGNAVNFWSDDYKTRLCDVAVDGSNKIISEGSTSRLDLGYDAGTNTVEVAVTTGILTIAPAGGQALPVLANVWAIGDEIEIDCGGVVGTVRYRVSALTGGQTLQLNNLSGVAIVAGAYVFRRVRQVSFTDEARKVINFELTWTPPLSIFKIGHALPSGKYELVLNPQPSAVYQKSAIESFGGDKVSGTTAGTFKFSIVDMYMNVNTVEGPRVDDVTYLLDLEQTRCQSEKIDNTSFQQKNWDVSPSSYALTVAYQDLRAGTDTRISASKFKSYDAGITTQQETKLERFFIQYAGQSLPTPDADPNFTTTADYTTQRYVESQMYNGAYYDAGGPETLQEFHNRGSYYYFSWPRDGTDRSTRVMVNQQFNNAADVANLRVLLFDHSKAVARIRIQSGQVIDVSVEDA